MFQRTIVFFVELVGAESLGEVGAESVGDTLDAAHLSQDGDGDGLFLVMAHEVREVLVVEQKLVLIRILGTFEVGRLTLVRVVRLCVLDERHPGERMCFELYASPASPETGCDGRNV